jgi:hypothetical protein
LSIRREAGSSRSSHSPVSRRPRSRASSTSRSAREPRSLSGQDFLRRVPESLRRELPDRLKRFSSGSRWQISQIWFGNSALHYEVWLRERLGTLEVGLHFESDPLTNARLLAAFQAREREIHRSLGPAVRVEGWDKGWARVWEPLTIARVDTELLSAASSRVASYVRALEPILRDEIPSDVDWDD